MLCRVYIEARWAKRMYDIKNSRIEQSGLTDHLHKGVHHN